MNKVLKENNITIIPDVYGRAGKVSLMVGKVWLCSCDADCVADRVLNLYTPRNNPMAGCGSL